MLFTNLLSNSCGFVVYFSPPSELFQTLFANCFVRENKKFSSSPGKVKVAVRERRDLEENLQGLWLCVPELPRKSSLKGGCKPGLLPC